MRSGFLSALFPFLLSAMPIVSVKRDLLFLALGRNYSKWQPEASRPMDQGRRQLGASVPEEVEKERALKAGNEGAAY